jgi:hypothetical protein
LFAIEVGVLIVLEAPDRDHDVDGGITEDSAQPL